MSNHRSGALPKGLLMGGLLGVFALFTSGQVPVSDPPDSTGARGFSADGQYSLSQIESVDAVNGNVNLSIPLAHLPPGPGGFSFGLNLTYNSAINDITVGQPNGNPNNAGGANEYLYTPSMHGGGWNYGYNYTLWAQPRFPGQLSTTNNPSGTGCGALTSAQLNAWFKNFLTTPDGSNHLLILVGSIPTTTVAGDANDAYVEYDFSGHANTNCSVKLPPYSGTLIFATGDSSFIRVEANTVSQTWIAYLPDGTNVSGTMMVNAGVAVGDATQVTDRNGNVLTIGGNCSIGTACTTTLQDAQLRTVSISFESNPNAPNSCGTGTWQDTISSPGVNGALTTTVNWQSYCPTGLGYLFLANLQGTTITGQFAGLSPFMASDVTSIELPPAITNGNGTIFTFGYNSLGGSWGELHSLAMCNGTGVSSCTAQWSAAYTYQFDTTGSSSTARPPATAINPIASKTLLYQELRDGTANVPITELTAYSIPVPASAFTYPNTGTSTVTHPDGSSTIIYATNFCVVLKSRDFCPSLAYKIQNPDSSITELAWGANTSVPTCISGYPCIPSGALFNPYVQLAVSSPAGATGSSSGVSVVQDVNGNTAFLQEYDWIPYGSVQRGTTGPNVVVAMTCPQSSLSCPLRTTATTYFAQTQPYWQHGAPSYLRAKNTTLVTLGTNAGPNATCMNAATCVQYTYDNPLTTGNVTQMQQFDNAQNVMIGSSWTYLPNGNLSTYTDPNGNVTQVTYDTNNLYPTQVLLAAGQSTQRKTTYQFGSVGLEQSEMDDNGVETQYITYDNLGRATKVTQTGSGLSRQTSTAYDDVKLEVTTTQSDTPSQSLVNTTYYDPLGRIRYVVDGAGDQVQKAYRYGAAGSLVSYELESNPYVSISDPNTMGWTVTTRNAVGRVTTVQHYAGSALPMLWGGSNSNITGTKVDPVVKTIFAVQ